MERQWVRWGGAAGIGFVVLIMTANLLPGAAPAADEPVRELREYWVDNRDELVLGSLLSVLATPLFFWFLFSVRDVVRRVDGDGSPLGGLVLLAGTVVVVLATVGASIGMALVYTEDVAQSAGDDVVRAVWDASTLPYVFTGTFFFIMIGAFALAILRGGGMPIWLGWLSAFLAVVGLVAAAVGSLDSELSWVGFNGFLAFMLWVLVTSIVLLAQRASAPSAVVA